MLDPLLRLLPLDSLPRTGWVLAGVPAPESIAGHVLGAAHLGLALAACLDPPVDQGRLLGMILVHDLAEAASGDLPQVAGRALPEGAKAAMEDTLARGLAGPLGLESLWEEYVAAATREARLARLCDKLQLGVRLVGYLRAGQAGLDDFRGGLEDLDCAEFPPAAALQHEILAAIDGGEDPPSG